MFEFIPNKLSSKEAFSIVDEFYDGWFTSRNIGWNDVLTYFPGADNWDRATLFSGLLWMYYNYPIDFISAREDKIPGVKLYRQGNFHRVACFLVQSGMNKSVVESILTTMAESNMQGKYPAAKNIKTFEIDVAMKGEGFPDLEQAVIKESTKYAHPFGRQTKAGRVPVVNLKKRTKKGVIFTKKAIDIDNELTAYLNFEFTKLFGRKQDKKQEKKAVKVSQLKRKMEEEERKNKPRPTLLTLLDQINRENVQQNNQVPQYTVEEPKLRHNITNKQFVPFVYEEINLDIDPNVIADKITELTKSKSYPKSSTGSKRSDFSTESFVYSDKSGTPLNWDDDASSSMIEI